MQTLRQAGVTVIELMITIVVLAILVALAAPAMNEFVQKRRLISAGEEIYSQLQFARSEAVKQSSNIRVNVTSATWCIGLTDGAANCDCSTGSPACTISMGGTNVPQLLAGSGFPGITLATNTADFLFEGVRGTTGSDPDPAITLTAPNGLQLRVLTNFIGRISICSPSGTGNVAGYPTC